MTLDFRVERGGAIWRREKTTASERGLNEQLSIDSHHIHEDFMTAALVNLRKNSDQHFKSTDVCHVDD